MLRPLALLPATGVRLPATGPDRPGPYYYLARTFALAGKRKEAIRAVEQAVKRGFNRPDLLELEEFNELQGDAEFQKLMDAAARNASGVQ